MDDDQKTRMMSTVRNIVNGGIDDLEAYGRLHHLFNLFPDDIVGSHKFRKMMQIVGDWSTGRGINDFDMYERLQTLFSKTS